MYEIWIQYTNVFKRYRPETIFRTYGQGWCYMPPTPIINGGGITNKQISIHPMIFLFVWFDSLRPINNLSVIKGWVFLGWISTKLGLMFLLKDTRQWCRWGLNPRPLGLESSTLPLSHYTPHIQWYSQFHNPSILFQNSLVIQVTCSYITWLNQLIKIDAWSMWPASNYLQ